MKQLFGLDHVKQNQLDDVGIFGIASATSLAEDSIRIKGS